MCKILSSKLPKTPQHPLYFAIYYRVLSNKLPNTPDTPIYYTIYYQANCQIYPNTPLYSTIYYPENCQIYPYTPSKNENFKPKNLKFLGKFFYYSHKKIFKKFSRKLTKTIGNSKEFSTKI